MKRVLSLDLETLSLDPRAVIIQIGAVVFDRDKINTYKELKTSCPTFDMTIDWQGQSSFGRIMDDETVKWWNRQNPKVIERMMNNPDVSYLSGVLMFEAWLRSNVDQYGIDECWVKGNRDGVWIETAFQSVAFEFPIGYRGIKCIRSVASSLDVPCPVVPEATHHNALSDALVQAMHVQQCHKRIAEYKESHAARRAA